MKGTLQKNEYGVWIVRYRETTPLSITTETLPLHPEFIDVMDTCFTSKFTQEVKFEIVTEWENGEVGINGLTYAKLINQVPDVRKMVEDDVWEVGLQDELNKLPYTKHLDDGQYNDGQLAGFELGATWGYNKAKETLYTEEQVREAIEMAKGEESNEFYDVTEYSSDEIIQSLKQPKKD